MVQGRTRAVEDTRDRQNLKPSRDAMNTYEHEQNVTESDHLNFEVRSVTPAILNAVAPSIRPHGSLEAWMHIAH